MTVASFEEIIVAKLKRTRESYKAAIPPPMGGSETAQEKEKREKEKKERLATIARRFSRRKGVRDHAIEAEVSLIPY